MHTSWYLRYDEIACWKCWVCKKCKHTSKWGGKPIWLGFSICYQCRGDQYRHVLGVTSLDWTVIGYWTQCHCPSSVMHTSWYLRRDNIACWKCRACYDEGRWDTYVQQTPKWAGKPLWFGATICYQCHRVRPCS